jgi:ribosomal protein S18 acetylase RimI-like enzyme
VGTATLQPLGTIGEVVGVSVLPEHRRRGIGTELTRFLVGEAHRRGVADVLLSAAPSAEGVYRRLGFRPVGTLASAPPDDEGLEHPGP